MQKIVFRSILLITAAVIMVHVGNTADRVAHAQVSELDYTQETSVVRDDQRMLNLLSLKRKARNHELEKYGVYKWILPGKRLKKIEEAIAHYEMAQKLIKITNFPAARIRLNKALQIEPNFFEAHLLYADLYVAVGEKQLELKHRELAAIASKTTYPLFEQRTFLKDNLKTLQDLFYGDNRNNIILRYLAVLVMLVLVGALFTMSAVHEKHFREEEYKRVMGDGTFGRDESIDQLIAKMKGDVHVDVHKYKMTGVYGIPFVFFFIVSNLFNFQGILLLVFSIIPTVIYNVVIHMLYFKSSITTTH
ncbi:tetratricopeptide repeat protein [Candidatus Omnitrophota bacterium]